MQEIRTLLMGKKHITSSFVKRVYQCTCCMKITNYFFMLPLCLVVLTTACNQPDNKSKSETTTDTLAISPTDSLKSIEQSNKDSISLNLVDGSAQQEALMAQGKRIVFSFETKILGKLSATVKAAEPNGNVRIAQIFMPDNSADGPFGQEMEYNLKEPGVYRIVVSENQMAGNPYNGPFTIKIKISRR